MALVPLTEENVLATRLVLNVETVGLSEEQFFRLCSDNRDLRMELTARKELVILPPAGLMTGWRNNLLCYYLTDWALKDGQGLVFHSSTGPPSNSKPNSSDPSWLP